MPLYIGGNKVKLNIDDAAYILNIPSVAPTVDGISLVSSEGYFLQDSNGFYLITKEDE